MRISASTRAAGLGPAGLLSEAAITTERRVAPMNTFLRSRTLGRLRLLPGPLSSPQPFSSPRRRPLPERLDSAYRGQANQDLLLASTALPPQNQVAPCIRQILHQAGDTCPGSQLDNHPFVAVLQIVAGRLNFLHGREATLDYLD